MVPKSTEVLREVWTALPRVEELCPSAIIDIEVGV